MQSLDEVKDEVEIKRKIRQKNRVCLVLLLVNAVLLAYAGTLAVCSIVNAVKKNTHINQGDIITVLNKNENDSKKIYSSYVEEKLDVLDIATYGRYLITSKSHISPILENVSNKVRLMNLEEVSKQNNADGGVATSNVTLGTKFDEQIDLFSLKKGDYIIHDADYTKGYKAYHYAGNEYYEDTLYSFPTQDGRRNKITIKGKASSPALVISVSTQEASLPVDYYDLVVIKDKNIDVDWFESTGLKIKEVETVVEAYKLKASYAVNIVDGNNLVTSNYVKEESLKPSLINSQNVYNNLDSDNAIRELGGYAFNAGYGLSGTEGYANISRDIKKVITSSHVGKYAITVGREIENPLETIKNIFKF